MVNLELEPRSCGREQAFGHGFQTEACAKQIYSIALDTGFSKRASAEQTWLQTRLELGLDGFDSWSPQDLDTGDGRRKD